LVLAAAPRRSDRHSSGIARRDKKGCCTQEIDQIKIKNVAALVISTE
jgi:hypothetical protein